nr:DMT family protein [Snodgrassella alvi]
MHYLIVICLLTASNLVMTTAWYWHIKPNNCRTAKTLALFC